ncbi:hypothetical protein [Natrinema longum]|uniref:Uncharacterized protein n=1 Tax=Natrinema longum TaxID=370324 RepID=A0A8A2UDD7_9EURY|nr:hypothetical protein [Natrinema longum]MBZ6495434.1 hypothetical protein [Natrinema longum]QSW86594.1 hypothetical protein J0X27_07205 [Natrinema longum]
MPIDRKRFVVVFLVANVVLIGFLAGVASVGAGVAVPATGVGGFTVAFDELRGDGFEQYSTMESHEGCERYPVSETRIQSGTIEGLHLFKDLEMPVTDDTFRVSIEAEHVEFEGLNQRFTHLEGDIRFEEDQVVEYEEGEERMRISSPDITIEDGTIQTENQYITQLSLEELDVAMVANPEETDTTPPVIDCQAEHNATE